MSLVEKATKGWWLVRTLEQLAPVTQCLERICVVSVEGCICPFSCNPLSLLLFAGAWGPEFKFGQQTHLRPVFAHIYSRSSPYCTNTPEVVHVSHEYFISSALSVLTEQILHFLCYQLSQKVFYTFCAISFHRTYSTLHLTRQMGNNYFSPLPTVGTEHHRIKFIYCICTFSGWILSPVNCTGSSQDKNLLVND